MQIPTMLLLSTPLLTGPPILILVGYVLAIFTVGVLFLSSWISKEKERKASIRRIEKEINDCNKILRDDELERFGKSSIVVKPN